MSVKKIAQPHDKNEFFCVATPMKIDLRNAHAIRRELASVYRDMRTGIIEPADGTKLAYVLDSLRKAYESSVLEDQIAQITNQLKR